MALFLRDRPQDVGLLPYGETGEVKPVAQSKGNPVALAFGALHGAVRVKDFWILAGTYFVCGASTNGLIGTHLIPACIDHGYSEVTGAALLATMGVFNFIGVTSSGWLADKFDNRVLLFTYYGLRGLSLFYLPFSFVNFYTMTLFAVFYGLDWFATVSPTVRMLDQYLWPRQGSAGLWLGVHASSAWRGVGRVHWRPAPRELRRLHGSLHALGRAVPGRRRRRAIHRRRA